MQALQDNFFYSNPRLAADGGSTLQDERQLLVEEQNLCKVRARKFSLETTRRRKALEERRKLWDVQEQRLRENILQQRRQRVQDATERFQRAHLPLSQRHRQPSRRNVPNIEEALNQIQGSLSSHSQQSSFLSSNFHISRCTTSPKPPTVPKSSSRQALSAVEAYTKLLQEQSAACFKNTQETEKIQDTQQDHRLQESQMSDSCNSESLSSKDSLEIEDLSPTKEASQRSTSSFLVDSQNTHPVLRTQSDLYPRQDLTFSAVMLLGDNLLKATKLHEPKQKQHEESEGLSDKIYVSKSSWEFTSKQTPKTGTRNNCNILTFCELISADAEQLDANAPQKDTKDNVVVTNRVTPSSTANQEALLDLREQKAHDDRQLKHPSATEILLPAKNSNSKDIFFGSSPKPNIFLNDNTIYNVSHKGAVQQTGKENHYLLSQKEPSASINNLNKVSTSVSKAEKPVTALLQHACLSNIQSDALKCLQCHEEDLQEVPVSVRFIKGILKKQSKYISDDTTCVYDSRRLIFAEQVALRIRDSIELTRVKAKDVEANKTVKKKLRWLDEVHMEQEDKEQNMMKELEGKTFIPAQSNSSSEDHRLRVTTVSGASRSGPIVTPAASTGYHFTKHAWADVGVQVSLPQEQADEVKVPRSSTRTPKVPRRERSTRVDVGPVSSWTRKGTVIRPQSATEVSHITKTQGKLIVPRPPPRMEEKMAHITKTPYGSDHHASVSCKQALAADQVLHKDNSEGFLSPHMHHGLRTDSSVMYTAEGSVKGTPSSGHQETHGCSRRTMVFAEKGLCLNCTPTDEEISQLWHGVRSALATKEAMLGRQALESGRVVRKPSVEQSRNPASGNRRLPQPSQPKSQTADSARLFSSLQSAAYLHMSQAGLEERGVAAMETAQTQRPGPVQQCSQQQGFTTMSLEEQKILLSLDRLNHRLHCVQDHVGGNTGARDLVLIDPSLTKEVKASIHLKNRVPSASGRSRFQRKT